MKNRSFLNKLGDFAMGKGFYIVLFLCIAKLLGGSNELLLGDLIEQYFVGTSYNPYLGSAVALVMMVIVVVCMAVMNRFGEGEEQAVML